MRSKHGCLEGAILSTLWKLEKDEADTITVKDVFESLNQNSQDKKAYTTVKTVMDRLCAKGIVSRRKRNNKICYKTIYSKNDIIKKSLLELSDMYCCGNIEQISAVLNKITSKKDYARV